jgi:hypothetical protein
MPERQNSTAKLVRSARARPRNGTLDLATTRLLVERTRVGLGIVLVSLAVLWATDVSLEPTLVVPLSVITLL